MLSFAWAMTGLCWFPSCLKGCFFCLLCWLLLSIKAVSVGISSGLSPRPPPLSTLSPWGCCLSCPMALTGICIPMAPTLPQPGPLFCLRVFLFGCHRDTSDLTLSGRTLDFPQTLSSLSSVNASIVYPTTQVSYLRISETIPVSQIQI